MQLVVFVYIFALLGCLAHLKPISTNSREKSIVHDLKSNPYTGITLVEHLPAAKNQRTTRNGLDSTLNIVTCCQGKKCIDNFGVIKQSLSDRGFNLFRIEVDGNFSWPKLAFAYADFAVQRLPKQSIAVFLDSSDMLAQGCPNELLRKFQLITQSTNRSILAGVESHCSNAGKCHQFKRVIPSASRLRPELQYLNGGFVMGKVQACADAWREIGNRFQDTQLGWGVYADEHPDIVALDWDQIVVASNTASEWNLEFIMEPSLGVQPKYAQYNIINSVTHFSNSTNISTKPIFLHVLCRSCTKSHSIGKGGPEAYARIANFILNVNKTCS